MIFDHRTYTIRPNRLAKFLETYERLALPLQRKYLGEPYGFFVTNIGPLSRVVHLWQYESLADREQRRGETWVGRRHKAPAGLVRIGVLNALAQIYLLPKLPELLSRYPELSIEFVDSDGYQDLVSEGLDLWIRLGDVAASTLITRSLSHSPRVAVATVEYLRHAGEPMHPTDLTGHECIIFTGRSAVSDWTFQGKDGPIVVPVSGRVWTDSCDLTRDAVLRGLGIGLMPAWLIHNELRAGTARAVLTQWELPRLPIHVVYPTRRLIPPRTRVVLDFLIEQARFDPAVPVLATARAA